MSGSIIRISQLAQATLPLTGTEEIPLRVGSGNARVSTTSLGWFVRGLPVAQLADSLVAGGNARGANAVDWQTVRSTATQVASGARAAIGGGGNNTASGQEAFVGGGSGNTASNTQAFAGGGVSILVSGLRAVAVGGNGNTASGQEAFVGAGQGNTASGIQSSIAGGASNLANGQLSWCPGGWRGSVRSHYGRGAWASGGFAGGGDAQAGEFVLRALTTDATATRATADQAAASSTNTANLPNNGTYRLKLLVVAQQTGGSAGTAGDCASWEANVLIKRGANAAATVFVGGSTFTNAPALAAITSGTGFTAGLRDAAAAAWTIAVSADTTNGGLNLTVTGEANKTIRWVARVQSVEVTA